MIYWLAYILIEAIAQGYLIEQKNWKPNYFVLFITRGWASIIHGILLNVQADPWYQYPMLVAFQATSFWIVFDVTLNKLRGKHWNYKGKTSGWLDSLPDYLYGILKVVALVAIPVSYYLYQVNFN